MSTEVFLLAFSKFVARRGRPMVVFSDNGTNFTGASHLLRSVDWAKVQEHATVEKIRWQFNPPTAAWWGGFWERLIGLVKDLLRRVLGSRSVKQAQLEVILLEVETIMNQRPLTYISDDHEDLRPLTPAHFLRDIPISAFPELDVTDGKGLIVNWKKMQAIKKEFRLRFRKEYLGQLVSRVQPGISDSLQPGSVVLVEMDNMKRLDWPLGVVREIFQGNDGVSRLAKVKTTRGIVTRPIQRLFPLETKDIFEEVPAGVFEDNVQEDPDNE